MRRHGGRRPLRGTPLLFLVLFPLLASVLLAGNASAHAVLQSANPPPNGHADAGLARIDLVFTEDVEREFTDADVYGADLESRRVGSVVFGEKRNVLHIDVSPLEDGIYSVSWQTLSVDTHTARGSFLFAVGNATLQFAIPPASHDPSSHDDDAIRREGLARAGFYVGLFVGVGGLLFALLVLREAPPRIVVASGVFSILGGASGALVFALFEQRLGTGYALAASTEAGTWLVTRATLAVAGGLAALASLLVHVSGRRPLLGLAMGLGALSLLTTALGSHAAAVKDWTALSIALDLIHLATGAIWIGGIFAFALAVPGRDAPEIGRLVTRFSPLAVGSVVALLATGVYASLQHIPRMEALWEERYGRLVLVKVALLGVLVLLGAYNQRWLGPALRKGTVPPRRFLRTLQLEASIMVAVLAAAGILASTPPPDTEVEGATTRPVFVEEREVGKTHVILQIAPAPVTVGIQRVTVTLHPLGGPDLPNGTAVALKFREPSLPEPEETRTPERTTKNDWSLQDGIFTRPGTWKVYVLVQRPDDDFHKLVFDVEVAPAGGQTP